MITKYEKEENRKILSIVFCNEKTGSSQNDYISL